MTYDYFCDSCNSAFELKHSMADCDKPHTCPICGSVARRVLQTPTVIWTGRALMRENGIDDNYVFPKMQSVRREDMSYRGISFNEQST